MNNPIALIKTCQLCGINMHAFYNDIKIIICNLFPKDEELARQLVELGYRGSGEVSINPLS